MDEQDTKDVLMDWNDGDPIVDIERFVDETKENTGVENRDDASVEEKIVEFRRATNGLAQSLHVAGYSGEQVVTVLKSVRRKTRELRKIVEMHIGAS